jgi:hypothetical protein
LHLLHQVSCAILYSGLKLEQSSDNKQQRPEISRAHYNFRGEKKRMNNSTLSKQLKNPVVLGVIAFLFGLFIGLVFLGWGLFPVKWINAAPEHLHPGWQEDYLRAAVDSFRANNNIPLAKQRYDALGAAGAETLQRIQANPGSQDPGSIQAFAAAVSAVIQPTAAPGATAVPVVPPTDDGGGGGFPWLLLIAVMCLLTLGVGAALLYFLTRGSSGPKPRAAAPVESMPMTSYAPGEEPIAQHMATYRSGDDLFDDSFSIDSPQGEFLGECGVGISETIGVGDPKKVAAFEVWLFDKNDIQTVTKVLMSAHTFADEAARQRMAAKGEPSLAEIGGEVILETQALQLVARVADMKYGEGALPAESFFEQFTLELAIWKKE